MSCPPCTGSPRWATGPPSALRTVFGNSMFTCFAYADDDLAGAGRVLADGLDCAYIAHVAVHPAHQGRGLGTEIIRRLAGLARGHKKIILYANRAPRASTPGSGSCA